MPFRNISVAVTATDVGLNTVLNRSGATVDNFGRRVERSGRLVNTTTNGMARSFGNLDNVISRGINRSMTGFVAAAFGGYAAGRALNAGLQAIVGGAVQFDTRMRNVNSIVHLSEGQLHNLGGELLGLSRKLPQSANTLAEGLYDIESSGFGASQGLIVLNAAGRAASAGLTDTATSSAAVAGVLNAYGEQAKDAQYVSDALFQTVNAGVLSFADLAQGIGQVVGTAAAGSVDIDQLGQAIATMTRGGIVPAEAFTSANQLLAQIIQPGQALAQVFHQLGYESGAAALQQKGLFGVMQDIESVTHGDVTATSELFTDIRSLRGALALGTNDGKLYTQVVRDWSSAHQGAGATAAAFAEQQKAVSFQWSILKNEAKATAVSFGTEVLPDLIHLMHGVEDLGHVLANDGVRHFLELVAAAYLLNKAINAGIAIRNSTLVTAVEREVAGYGAAAAGLTAEGAAATRATAALGELALAENSVAIAAGRVAVSGSIAGVAGATANLEGAGVAIGAGMGASMAKGVGQALPALLSTVLRRVLRGGIIALTGELAGNIVGGTTGGLIKSTGIGAGIGFTVGGPIGGVIGAGAGALSVPGRAILNKTPLGDAEITALNALDPFGAHFHRAVEPSVKLGAASMEVLQPLIDQYGDLATAEKVLREINSETAASQRDLGFSHKITSGNMEEELAALKALQKQRAEFVQQSQSAFFGAVDVTQQFQPDQGHQAVAGAQQSLLEAQRALRQEQTRYDAQKTSSVSSDITLANARERVAQATKDLAKAQHDAAQTGDLATIYRTNIRQARTFVTDVREAERRGLDPQLIGRLLRQGPAQAGPLLDAIVSDHSNRMIHLANTNERILRRIGIQAKQEADFLSHAILNPSRSRNDLARELPKALRLDQALKDMPAPATGAWLAEQLGMTPRQIRKLAQDFGITLPRFVQQTLNQHPVHVRVTATAPGQRRIDNFADGGRIEGPGTATSDSILARVSNGEFIVRAAAVNYYGTPHLSALNKMRMPRYADGGLVGQARPIYGSGPAVTVVRVVEKPVQYHSKNEVNLHGAKFEDARSWDAFEERQRARSTMP